MAMAAGKNVTLTKPEDWSKVFEDEGIPSPQLDKAVTWARKNPLCRSASDWPAARSR